MFPQLAVHELYHFIIILFTKKKNLKVHLPVKISDYLKGCDTKSERKKNQYLQPSIIKIFVKLTNLEGQ